MAQSDARFGYTARLSRDDHNLSQPLGFTCAPGMLLPIWYDFASPGDSFYISHDLPLLRSIQLIAPSMVDVKVHFETFFVPIQMIYQPAENILMYLKNLQSSFYNSATVHNQQWPLLDYTSIRADAIGQNAQDPIRADGFRLADLMGLGQMAWLDTSFASTGVLEEYHPDFFPYQLGAYHTIFQYYYRLDDKSQFSSYYCNFDAHYNVTGNVMPLGINIFKIHQRPWDFDYYTSLYRSPIVSDVNTLSVLPSSDYSPLNGLAQNPVDSFGNNNPVNNDIHAFAAGYYSGGANSERVRQSVNTAMIRQLFANEKLAMITGRTRKNYDAQVLAHYGVSVPHDVKHDITMVKHDSYDLQVQEVTSLASTSDAPLGELAGKSYAAGNGKQFKFTAPVHGVMMTIFSIEPKKRYITGFDRINAISLSYDFPVPEYDRMGNVPMYRFESNYQKGSSTFTMLDIIGWKERYYAFKRKMPKCTMAFYAANGVNNFGAYFLNSTPFGQSSISSGTPLSPVRSFPRPDVEDRFYIERGCLDNMCLVPFYDGFLDDHDQTGGENWNKTPWLLYSRDPFIVNTHIKCKKVSWLSKDGEPIYD